MSYIDRNLLPGEQIKFRTKKHPIIFASALALTIFAVYAAPYMTNNPILHHLAWAPWLVALLIWAHKGSEFLTSEFAVTNKRVMMREGFFYRHTNEVRLTAISQVNVEQSILGQIMNYGVVSINAFGAFDAYALIARPFQFQQYVNAEVDKAVKG
jgi:uncharacterized membrane protein YdbT with pleckstrin-like domain